MLASGLFNLELIRSIFPLYKLSPLISYRMLQLDFDGGYFEHFQYILLLWCFILSSSWIISKKYWEGFYISLIYLYLFIDDVFRIHDGFLSLYLSNLFEGNFISDQQIIRVKDFGEWFYWAIVFFVLATTLIPIYKKSKYTIKKFIKQNFTIFFSLAFFGLVIDLIGANWYRWIPIKSDFLIRLITIFLILFEECGEILVISFACIWLFSINFSNSIEENEKTFK